MEGESSFEGLSGHDLFAETAIEAGATADLDRMLQARPDLRRFVLPGAVDKAGNAIQWLRNRLRTHPEFLDDVSKGFTLALMNNRGKTVMLVIQDVGLVLTQTPSGEISGFAPILSCTWNAVRDLRLPAANSLVLSGNGLVPYALEQMEYHVDPIISYKAGMNPADYVALAAGSFRNETFRFRIQRGQLF